MIVDPLPSVNNYGIKVIPSYMSVDIGYVARWEMKNLSFSDRDHFSSFDHKMQVCAINNETISSIIFPGI